MTAFVILSLLTSGTCLLCLVLFLVHILVIVDGVGVEDKASDCVHFRKGF